MKVEPKHSWPLLKRTLVWLFFCLFLSEIVPFIAVVALAGLSSLPISDVIISYIGFATPQLIAFGLVVAAYCDHLIDHGCSLKKLDCLHLVVGMLLFAYLVRDLSNQYVRGATSPFDTNRDFIISSEEISSLASTMEKLDLNEDGVLDANELGYPRLSDAIWSILPSVCGVFISVILKRKDWKLFDEQRMAQISDGALHSKTRDAFAENFCEHI